MNHSLPVNKTALFLLTLLPITLLQAMEQAAVHSSDNVTKGQETILETMDKLGYKFCKIKGDSIICSRKFYRREVQIIISPHGEVKHYANIPCEDECTIQQDKETKSSLWKWSILLCAGLAYGSYKIAASSIAKRKI